MANSDRNATSTAAVRAKKKADQMVEGQKAMHEYEMGMRAMREKTERLRALRLAHEATEAQRIADAPPAPKKKKAVRKAKAVAEPETVK